MWFNPRESSRPVAKFAHGFIGVIKQAAGLWSVLFEDIFYFFCLTRGECSLIVPLEEVERVGKAI
jgi:uncharacterized membrane protein